MNAVAIAGLSPQNFPPDTIVGAVVFKLLDAGRAVVSSQSVPVGVSDTSASASFGSVVPGTNYVVSAERQDGNGNPLADAVLSDPFNVADTTPISVTVPTSVSVSLSA